MELIPWSPQIWILGTSYSGSAWTSYNPWCCIHSVHVCCPCTTHKLPNIATVWIHKRKVRTHNVVQLSLLLKVAQQKWPKWQQWQHRPDRFNQFPTSPSSSVAAQEGSSETYTTLNFFPRCIFTAGSPTKVLALKCSAVRVPHTEWGPES